MSGLTAKELDLIEFMEKSYKKQYQHAFIIGTIFGIAIGFTMGAVLILIL